MSASTREVSIIRVQDGTITRVGEEPAEQRVSDRLAIEEPLEIRLEYGPEAERKTASVSVTMRTPGEDAELATGFLFTEGIIRNAGDLLSVTHVNSLINPGNIILASVDPTVHMDLSKLERHFYTTSSCGVCGKASIDAIRTTMGHRVDELQGFTISSRILGHLPEHLRQGQSTFESTGGIHASGLFTPEGKLLLLREDVGRHNALDKLIGASLEQGLVPLNEHILLLSGRASFELIQKAAMAGIKIVAAVGAPSSLSVELATEFHMTLVGFLKPDRFNIYAGEHRIR